MSDARGISQFDNIYLGAGVVPGLFRLASSGVAWKEADGDKIVTVTASDMRRATWIKAARGHQLRIHMKNNTVMKFDGFTRDDYEKLRDIVKPNYQLTLEQKDLSIKGWNWGTTDFQGNELLFNVSNKTMFELPTAQIGNANLTSRAEVSLEFTLPEQQTNGKAVNGKHKDKGEDQLVEMRFYIPGTATKDGAEDQQEEEEESAAALFLEQIKDKADLGQVSGEGIILFTETLLLTPRGRYDIDMFPDFLRLRGKTYDYKLQYNHIIKLFLLPKSDDVHVLFVIGLDPPLRQGQTRYPFLVLQFVKDEEMDAELNLDEETLSTKYEGKLQKQYEQPTYQVVSTLFRVLTGRKVTVPGSFASSTGQQSVKASMKANEGFIYPLEKCFLFVAKQPSFIPHSEVSTATFSRVGGGVSGSRTFDLRFVMKGGNDYQFSSINREEYQNLEEFIKGKKIKVKNEMAEEAAVIAALEDALDADDSDAEVLPSKVRGADEDEDEESVDEDFVEGDDSEVGEEFDENFSGDSDVAMDD